MTRHATRISLTPLRPAAVTFVSLLVASLFACASAGEGTVGGTGSSQYGYLIAGPRVAVALGVSATDTLAELMARTTLPTALTVAISREVAAGNWNDRCTRRFGGPDMYVLIFHRACDAALGPDADPVVVVGFAAEGRKTGQIAWTGPGTVTMMVPARRF